MSVTDDVDGDAPICPWCGVTALPGVRVGRVDVAFVCDNEDCPNAGDPVGGRSSGSGEW